MVFIRPFFDEVVRVDIRTATYDIPKQDVITKDNVSVMVDAIVYYQVLEPIKAITKV